MAGEQQQQQPQPQPELQPPAPKKSGGSDLCTEEEPDDDFRSSVLNKGKKEKPAASEEQGTAKSQVQLQEQADAQEEEQEQQPTLPTLTGHWQQLQGVPRPDDKAAGPRFLAWSGHGHVASFAEEGRLEVQYAAVAGEEARPAQRLPDSIGLNMAAISPSACCLAAGAGAGSVSQLIIRPAERWEKAVFSAPLGGTDEAVEAVACGADFVAALTSKRLLRVYGLSGLPLGVVSTAGRSVALAAQGPFLLAVTGAPGHGAVAPEDDQDDPLEYRLLDVRSKTQRAGGRLPLSPCSRLRWLGLTTELVPIAIDTRGVARALLGTGAGSWGPAGGGGGEWTVIAQLAKEEEQVGPLWVVDARCGALLCAEVGHSGAEPQPPEPAAPPGGGLTALTATGGAVQGFGVGAALREVRWELPLGPVAACAAAAEEAMRESLLARHVEEMRNLGALSNDELAKAAAVSGGWRSKTFQLYGKLVQAEQYERALDVVRYLIPAAGGSNMMMMAQNFAEKAGCHKLADEVAALPRLVTGPAAAARAPEGPAAQKAAGPGAARAVPKVIQRELPPLFQPGEGGEEPSSGPTPSLSSQPASLPASQPSVTAAAGTWLSASQGSTASAAPAAPAAPQEVATLAPEPPTDAAAGVVPGALAGMREPPQTSPAATSAPSLPRAAGPSPAAANPFAKRQKQQPATTRAPHLLRDALGPGTDLRRPAATPTGGEPAAKAPRIPVPA